MIDTNVLISVERGRSSLTGLVQDYGDEPLVLASMTASELWHGVHRAKNPIQAEKRRLFVESIIDAFPVYSFDLEAARIHAALWAYLQSQGLMIGAHDLIIAATALAHNYGVLTANRREFERVPDLQVISPP